MCSWNKFQKNISEYMSKTFKDCLIEWKTLSHVHTVLFCLGCAHGFPCCCGLFQYEWPRISASQRDFCFFVLFLPSDSLADLLQQLPALSGAQWLMVPNKAGVGEKVGLSGLLWISKRRINCRSKDYTQGITTHCIILSRINSIAGGHPLGLNPLVCRF